MWLHAVVAAVAFAVSGIRWLRVAQREHYLPGTTSVFAWRWWRVGINPALAVIAVAAIIAAIWAPWSAVVASLAGAAGPVGLALKGRSGALAWTSRLRRVAGVAAVIGVTVIAVGAGLGWLPVVHAVALVAPVVVDAALAVLGPIERRAGDRWVARAAEGLESSGARVVAITGSYGKTSTKVMAAHLFSSIVPTVASPASFNNRMGLARAINEGLAPGTAVFVAEMGTYGPGEIDELCSWIAPEVGVMTAIGPVHLERMGSEENIARAKREILGRAKAGVINVDHPLLAAIAAEESARIEVVRCSSRDRDADVFADPASGEVLVGGAPIGRFDPAESHAGNVACAVGAVVAAGFDAGGLADRLRTLPVAPHRQTVSVAQRGFSIIDDTFNSNPAGARAALGRLAALDADRRVLVTPGMVELGRCQEAENRTFAARAGGIVDTLVVVGRTNRRALLGGASDADLGSVIVVQTREEAVSWVRENLTAGDAVLYENDLPDHYP